MEKGSRVYALSHNQGRTAFLYGFGVYEGDLAFGDTRPADIADAALLKAVRAQIEKLKRPELADLSDDQLRKLASQSSLTNPRIRLDDGRFVWGRECWWGPEADFNGHYDTIVPVDIDEERAQAKATAEKARRASEN